MAEAVLEIRLSLAAEFQSEEKSLNRRAGFQQTDSILEAVYDAAGDDGMWSQALDRVAAAVDAKGAMYCLFTKQERLPAVQVVHFSGFAAGSDLAYARDHNLLDPHVPLGMRTPVGSWFLSHEHFDRRYIDSHAFFRDVMDKAGIRWVAGARLWEDSDAIGCMAFQRETGARPYAESDRARLAELTPHLRRASGLHWRLQKHERRAALEVAALDGLSFGVVVLDAQRHVLAANRKAEAYLARPALFLIGPGGILSMRHPVGDSRLREAVREVGALRSSAFFLPDRDGAPALQATVLPLTPGAEWNQWQRPLVMLSLTENKGARSLPRQLLADLFRLTAAEARLANWWMSGRSNEEYATLRGLSSETIRSQSKSLLGKTGTRRQAELVALLARFSMAGDFPVDAE